MDFFGFSIQRKKPDADLTSFTPKETDDGALVVTSGGTFGTYVDMEGAAKTEAELIVRYRELALQPEMELALDQITNEAIVKEGNEEIVLLNLDDVKDISDNLKTQITDEFANITKMLNFNNFGYELFRRWFIDGRLYFHTLIDEDDPQRGIQEIRYIDPRKIRKIRLVQRERKGQVYINRNVAEFFVFSDKGFKSSSPTGTDNNGLKIAPDSIIHVTSGLMDKENTLVLSYLHKSIRPMNQLRMLEDATIIYALSRAPERRVFKVEVGGMPKLKADEFMRDMMARHKNRLVYDAATGMVRDDRKYMTMTEDFWVPMREGVGTEISQLPAGQNLGKMENVEYFKQKLYEALNIPLSRIHPDQAAFDIGKPAEISRDEVNFGKFIDRLRLRFSGLFLQLIEKQVILKKIFNQSDWDEIKDKIHFDYARDSFFAEEKDAAILRERMMTVQAMMPLIGVVYSWDYVKKNVLMMTDNDIEENKAEIEKERAEMAASGLGMDGQPMDMMNPGMGFGGPMNDPNGQMTPPAPKPGENDDDDEEAEEAQFQKDEKKRLSKKGEKRNVIVNTSTDTFTRQSPIRRTRI